MAPLPSSASGRVSDVPAKSVITGVAFAEDITTPIEVTEPATWGWWSGSSINIIRADSKAAAYVAARRVAGRRKTTVQIYANTGGGWTQVDVVPAPDRELCEWWPDGDGPATGRDGEYCPNEAVWSVGRAENWHLCESCAALPRFKPLRRRIHLAGGNANA